MTALLDVQPTPSRIRPRGHASPAQLVRDQIRDFLLRHLRDWTPDFIVVCERKGTAIMRALIENLDHPLDWPWPKVISTAAIGTLPPGFFKGVRVLVFDDMLRYGRHVSPLVDQLNDLGASPAQIRIVVYAAHEGAPSRLSTKCLTFDACLRRLTSDAYYRVRDAIKAFLQQSGSLMLDTEHLEVRFTLKGSFQQLLESLRRRADATVFHSLDYRANITVYYGEDSAYALPAQLFPSGTELTGIVKKCRVVQRSWNEFAIIPICLPSVSTTGTWELPQDYQRIFKKHYEGPGTTRFYSAALLGSLFPLQWVIRDLYASDEDLFSLSLPKGGSTSTDAAGYHLGHLLAMYPSLDTEALADCIAQRVQIGRTEGKQLRGKRMNTAPKAKTDDDSLYSDARTLLLVVSKLVDERRIESLMLGCLPPEREGLQMTEIFKSGQKLGWNEARVSALMDVLIDDADFTTRVEKRFSPQHLEFWVRTFKPDGEIVTDMVRRMRMERGHPRGF